MFTGSLRFLLSAVYVFMRRTGYCGGKIRRSAGARSWIAIRAA
jgi:hypothetical protein